MSRNRIVVLAILLFSSMSRVVLGQSEAKSVLETLDDDIQAMISANDTEYLDDLSDIVDALPRLLVAFAARRGAAQALQFRRDDVQFGSGATASGSTSSVSSPASPSTFGFALENGSITRSTSGSTVTISISPTGLFCALSGQPDAALKLPPCASNLQRASFALHFDTSQGSEEASGLQSVGDQFSGVTVRYELVNHRDPGSSAFKGVLRNWYDPAKVLVDLENRFSTTSEEERKRFAKGIEEAVARGRQRVGSDSERLKKLVAREIDRLVAEIFSDLRPDQRTALERLSKAWSEVVQADRRVYNQLAHGLIVTSEYSFERPDVSAEGIDSIVAAGTRPPSLHTGRLILAKGLTNVNLDFTLNIAGTWFGELLPGMSGRFRDVQLGGEARMRLPDIAGFGAPALSFSGLWMHLHQRPLGLPIEAFNEKKINEPGNLGIFQTKLELPTANAAVRIPVSFTYASRTELVNESDVRGQIGISLNLDAVFSKEN